MGWEIVLAGVVGLGFLGWVLPDVVFHHLQWGAFFARTDVPEMALTFDDGPGPDTPGILDALAESGTHATFFVVAEEARRRPELVKRMVMEGHEVGLHARRHRSSYLMMPWTAYREMTEGLRIVESITGRPVRWVRPPWGHVNWGTWQAIRRRHLTPVFWTVAPDDWKPEHSAEYISRYVVQLIHPGAVVVLHDAGGDRGRTRTALKPMVDGIRRMGLTPVTLSRMTPDPSYLRRVWTWWEIRFTRRWDIDSVPNQAGGVPVLRLGKIRYRGPRVTMDGMTLKSGDPMGEIHFGNPALSRLSGEATSGLKAFHAVLQSLRDLAEFVQTQPKYRDVVVVGGVTLLDAASAIEKAGFIRVPVRGWAKWSLWVYLTVLMAIYHRDGWKNLRRFPRLRPVMVLMSRTTLLTRYGGPRRPRTSRDLKPG
ncbi:polysaccharide deacetylase [Sulfobacillus acidophilus TPY]|uniref:Polysaccharide deacetylase n=1 Tax=Sulfobacillus acidophilus (strain ATCC 700253 / DSM 10332 / NAL) TaxID=679936 RepID=G8TVW7_SULAD|nr:polysaccharide deacetylase [Sulfobacillus acidophilus TPY]AEW04811.1 polysaccharide deacetylase [Sulfobacillus acidophilus DSM 10332]